MKRTEMAIISKAGLLGLQKKTRSNSPFTPAMERKLIKWYPDIRNKIIARRLGLNKSQIINKAFKLGLKKTPQFKRRWAKKGMFRPGQKPPNKGKKMPREQYNRCKETMFKRGHLPRNTLKDGAISIRKDNRGVSYKYIRIRQNIWIPYHRYRWEKFRGKIPAGSIVTFRDGDTQNCRLSNLMLITKAENAVRNHLGVPIDLTRTIIVHSKLNKTIKKLQNEK